MFSWLFLKGFWVWVILFLVVFMADFLGESSFVCLAGCPGSFYKVGFCQRFLRFLMVFV